MNQRQIIEQLLLTHPYFYQDNDGEPLAETIKSERQADVKDGFIFRLKRNSGKDHCETTLPEIHKAVGIIVEDPGKYFSPLGALRSFAFQFGKCVLTARSKSQRQKDTEEDEYNHMPKHVKRIFEMMASKKDTPEEAEGRRQHYENYPETTCVIRQPDGSFSRSFRPGRGETA